MPGLFTIKTKDIQDIDTFNNYQYLIYEDYMYKKNLINNKNLSSFSIIHKGYPSIEFSKNEIKIFLLGIIYNIPEQELEKHLYEIAACFQQNDINTLKSKIKSFINDADGDYIIQIIINNDILIFNDLMGRLPLYYSQDNEKILIASELKSIIINRKKTIIDKVHFLEYILYEFNLGNNTLYKDISRLTEGSMLIIKKNLVLNKIDELSFKTEKSIKKENFLKVCEEKLKSSVSNRLNKVSSKYSIYCDISGGLDSRTIVGAVKDYPNINYHTFEYITDESFIAKKVISKIVGNTNNYTKYSFENSMKINDVDEYVFITDALTNYYTAAICFEDLKYMRMHKKDIGIRIMGLGVSDFIRNYPFAYRAFISLKNKRKYNYGVFKNIYNILDVLDLKKEVFENKINTYFDSIKETKNNDILKRLYFEYQSNYVSIAGEERERIHFYGVLPLWSLDLMKVVSTGLNLRWVGFTNYISFMNKINLNLAKIPIFQKNINIESKSSMIIYDLYLKLRHFFKYYLREIYFGRFKKQKVNQDLIKHLKDYRIESFSNNLLDIKKLEKLDSIQLMRIITVFKYVTYLKKEFKTKVEFEK